MFQCNLTIILSLNTTYNYVTGTPKVRIISKRLCTVRFKLIRRSLEKSTHSGAREVVGNVIKTCEDEGKSLKQNL